MNEKDAELLSKNEDSTTETKKETIKDVQEV